MSVGKIRLTFDTKEECDRARKLIEDLTGAKMNAPQEGRNPKYADNQKWFSYGEWVIEDASKKVQRGHKRGESF